MKRICVYFLAVAFVFHWYGGSLSARAASSSGALPKAKSALVIDSASGKVLFSRLSHTKRQPASTVKLMTALVAMDTLPLDDVVTIDASVTRTQPTHIHLRPGERFYVRDLLRAVLINSANDAAKALAVASAGSEWRFVSRMNEKAKALGATHSHFMTPNGLPAENQYSTAYDFIQIFREAEKSSFIVKTLGTKHAMIHSLGGRKVYLKNHNKMLFWDAREFIGKTGWTRAARHCFVGRIRHGNRSVYVSLFGSSKKWDDLRYFADRYVGGASSSSSRSASAQTKKKGSRGHNVTKIQSALREAGYFHRKPTGYFGSITRRALIQFQKAKGLKPDGIVGPKTWAMLSRYLPD